ncbi:MAG TPA: cytoplasmic protein [bacterium]|nr:cytoplasmic protein [bacterium]
MSKTVFFVFRKDLGTFIHAMLNAIDMKEKGHDALIILEDKATALLFEVIQKNRSSSDLFEEVVKKGLVGGVCRACSLKTESAHIAEEFKLNLIGDMKGHPSMQDYIDKGYSVIIC